MNNKQTDSKHKREKDDKKNNPIFQDKKDKNKENENNKRVKI